MEIRGGKRILSKSTYDIVQNKVIDENHDHSSLVWNIKALASTMHFVWNMIQNKKKIIIRDNLIKKSLN